MLNPAHHSTTRLAATRVNHVIQPVKNVIVLHMMIAQYVRKVITCTEILVLQIAQHFSTHSKEYVITAMKTVKNVLATQQTNVRLVRRVTIFNLMPLLVNKPAQQHTTLMITAGHVNPVMLPVRNVQIRWIILALSVNKGTICNLIIRLALLVAPRHPTTPIVRAKNVSHVMKPVLHAIIRRYLHA